jgi:hypothetical protein
MLAQSIPNTLSWIIIILVAGLFLTGSVQLARRGERVAMDLAQRVVLVLIAVVIFVAQVITAR